MHIYLLVPVSSRLHGLSGSVLVPKMKYMIGFYEHRWIINHAG